MDELWRLGASELADLIRKREVKSREVVDAHLERIAATNPALNAVTVTLTATARAAADRADAELASGAEPPPLHGVPFTVKENIDLAGSATTQGLVAMEHLEPEVDAPHIAQLKAAGAIAMARTNLPDLGLRWHTDNALRNATRNPWDAGRSPGGSSGGEAAALAVGMTPLGVGNDLGGSVRVPAQFCGIASIKPTLGRVADASALAPEEASVSFQLMAVQGPMARRVADVRLALENMSGPDPRDPWWTPAPLLGPALDRRIAVWHGGDDAQVDTGVDAAAGALADAGYAVEAVEPPQIAEAMDLWRDLVLCESRYMITMVRPLMGPDAVTFIEDAFGLKPDLDKDGYVKGLATRNELARAWSQFQVEHPLVLGPVCTRRPFPVGRDLDGPDAVAELLESMRLVVLVNLLGLPAAAVPVGVAEGLPQGVQLIGPRFREDACLDAAQAIEDRLGTLTAIDPR